LPALRELERGCVGSGGVPWEEKRAVEVDILAARKTPGE